MDKQILDEAGLKNEKVCLFNINMPQNNRKLNSSLMYNCIRRCCSLN